LLKVRTGSALLLVGLLCLTACQQEGKTPTGYSQPPGGEIIDQQLPPEYEAYQAYLDVIHGKPGQSTAYTIEGTILSLLPGEICPYPQEICPIEPYPSDWGRVRVDGITSGAASSSAAAAEQPGAKSSGEGEAASAPYQGQDIQTGKAGGDLQVGGEYDALFQVTSRPVIVQYLPLPTPGPAVTQAGGVLEGMEQAAPAAGEYPALPKEGITYVLTTQVGNFPGPVRKSLPGLQPGDRFRAQVWLSEGILYIAEYEILQ